MDWHEIAGWLLAAVAAVAGWVWRNRQQLLLHAAEAVAFAEKFYLGEKEQVLEAQALRYVSTYWPRAPHALVVLAIREICRRRKARSRALVGGAKR